MQHRRRVKNNNRSNYQKSNFARAAHFFVHFFAVVLHDYNVNVQKLPSCTFHGGNVVRVLVHFFPLPLIFTLHYCWPLSFLMLSPPLQNIFFKSPSPFFSLSFAGLPPTFSFSLSFSCSIFQICGHDNLSKLNTLDNTDTEKISAFLFRLY